jgi:hypothetical protein
MTVIEDAFNEFEWALDQQLYAMNINENNNGNHLHASGVWPHPDDSSDMRSMVFGNPALIPLLKNRQLEFFVDATFDCVPCPFYQCLIVMVYHDETSAFVPVLYALMTHKNETLYWHVFSAVVYCSEWKIRARTYTTDFEQGLMNQMAHQFEGDGAKHVGCLFHLKQAWRKHRMHPTFRIID